MAVAAQSPGRSRERLRMPTGGAAGVLQARDRIQKWREQLNEASASLNSEGHSLSRRPSLGSEGEAAALQPWLAELKRSKFAFSDADMRVSLIKGCWESSAPWAVVDESRTSRTQDAKQRNKELKQARLREEDLQTELYKSLAEAIEEAQEASSTGWREYDLLQSQQDMSEMGAEFSQHAGEGEDLDLCPAWANGPHCEAAADAQRETEELVRITDQRQRESEKRQHFEAELQSLELELKKVQARSKTYRQQQKQAFQCVDSLEKLHEAHLQLGFPDITFHEVAQSGGASQCTVVLSGSGVSADEAVRTVMVKFGPDGDLSSATPHASLGLQQEAAAAVKCDDLSALLTMVWHRICEPTERKRRKPSRGGA